MGTFLSDISDIIELKDSSVVMPNINGSVDGGGTANFNYELAIVDKNWQNLDFCWHEVPSTDKGPKGYVLSDNSLVLYNPEFSAVTRSEVDCQTKWGSNTDFQIYDLAVTSDDRLVWAGNNGLAIMDAGGNIDTVYPDILFDEVQTTSFDGIVGLWQDSLFLISSDFVQLQSHHFPDDNILDYSVRFGKVAVLTENRFVHVFNDSLVFQNSFELLDESEFRLVDIGPEGLAFAGLETYGSEMPSGGTEAFFTKSYSFSGDNYDMSRDIGIADVQLGEVSHVAVDPVFPNYNRFYFNDASVTVENFGDEVVNGFFIRSQNPFLGFSQHLEDVALEASGSLTLALDDFWVRSQVEPGGLESVCLWTSHPDKRLDEDSANDGYCTDFLVGTEDGFPQNSFKLYPNPTHGMLNLQWNDKITSNDATCRIINAEGKVIKQMGIDLRQGMVTIPVENWLSGLYFIQIFGDSSLSYSESFLVIK